MRRSFQVFTLLALLAWSGNLQAASSVAREWNEQLLGAIRINVPNPPLHARNLHHLGVVMYDAWAAYDSIAVGYLYPHKVSSLPTSPQAIEAARNEAISYAAYRLLRSRFTTGNGAATTLGSLDMKLAALGYSAATAQASTTLADTPAELGKRIADTILAWGINDGFNMTSYPQAYTAAVNPNLNIPLTVLGTNLVSQANMPLGFGIPAITQPNFWQPLALSTSVSQNGIPTPGGVQSFIGVQSLATTPFSLTRADTSSPWLDPFGGPSKLSLPGVPSPTDADYKQGALAVVRASSLLNDPTLVDISPATLGNNPLGTDSGSGYPNNPITGAPFAANLVKRSDYVRVLAETWADGPNSETPPGHWHLLANEVADSSLLVKRIGGEGAVVNDLEWDVKTYFALGAAMHDAACAAWSLKRYYSGARPITMIRYMGSLGQSSEPLGPSYHPQGLPLESGVVEVITATNTAPGGKHFLIWDVAMNGYDLGASHLGEIAVFAWPGEHRNNLPAPATALLQSTVRWMLAKDWLPYQRKTFNTPAFPGYVSGHSTFSRAAAEVLRLHTGSSYFPGGLHEQVIAADSMQMDRGPSAAVRLQWASYYDAADQAGQSRRWGGIHVSEDDYHGRIIGAEVGITAYQLAKKYWTGSITEDSINAAVVLQPNGDTTVTWNATRGMNYQVQTSPDLEQWTSVTDPKLAYDNHGSWTDTQSRQEKRFYRIIRTHGPSL